MSKTHVTHHKTDSSSSSSDCSDSSSSSISCSDKSCYVKKVKRCGSPCKPNNCPPKYTAEEIYCKYKDAVVNIESTFILTAGTDRITSSTPLAADLRNDVFLRGNGFFVMRERKDCKDKCAPCKPCKDGKYKKDKYIRYIVCPAHLVLMPPSLTSVVRRFPFQNPPPALGVIRDDMVRASRIVVSVNNVNLKGCAYAYEAELVGVDGAGDMAILKINHDESFNSHCNPKIECCHPYFKWGKSCKAEGGSRVYMIGDPLSHYVDVRSLNAMGAIVDGIVSDNRYVDYEGYALPELFLVSTPAYAFSSGLPIIDTHGRVLAMQTADVSAVSGNLTITQFAAAADAGIQGNGTGFVAGPSQFFMEHVFRTLVKGASAKRPNKDIESICDPAGQYYRFVKAYLGVAYQLVRGSDYITTTDYTSGALAAGRPRVRLNPDGGFTVCPRSKKIVGIKVIGLAGLNPADATGVPNGHWYVPGGTGPAPLPALLPVSSLIPIINPGDIITSLDGYALGDANCQIAPALITWRLTRDVQIDIAWKTGGNVANNAPNGDEYQSYVNCKKQTFCVSDFPRAMDYPWYRLFTFPLISIEADPVTGFTFPATQSINPQTIQLNTVGAGIFHPAL